MTTEMPPSEVSNDVHERFESWLNEDEAPAEEPEEVEGEAVEAEPAEVEDEAEDSEQEQPEAEDDEPDSEDETETLNIDGEEITLPKAVAEKVTAIKKRMEADYTRKTQEAAEMRKSAETLQQRVNQEATFNQQNTDLLVEYKSIDKQLQEYKALTPNDWAAIAQQDITAYTLHKDTERQLEAKQQQIGQELGKRQQYMDAQKSEEHRVRVQNTIDTVRKAIPTYDEATDKKAVQTAVKLGEKYGLKVDPDVLSQTLDPLVWIGLVELGKYLDVVDKRPATQKQVEAAPKVIKPTGKPQKSSTQSRTEKIQKLLAQGRIREASLL